MCSKAEPVFLFRCKKAQCQCLQDYDYSWLAVMLDFATDYLYWWVLNILSGLAIEQPEAVTAQQQRLP